MDRVSDKLRLAGVTHRDSSKNYPKRVQLEQTGACKSTSHRQLLSIPSRNTGIVCKNSTNIIGNSDEACCIDAPTRPSRIRGLRSSRPSSSASWRIGLLLTPARLVVQRQQPQIRVGVVMVSLFLPKILQQHQLGHRRRLQPPPSHLLAHPLSRTWEAPCCME